jgi:hypothetical protein
MKNEHILPNTEVPIELRKEVYKEALRVIENWDKNKKKYNINSNPELCWFLIMVLYGAKEVLHDHPVTNETISFHRTKTMFPELETFLKRGYIANYTNQERIEFLKSVI